MDKSWIDDPNIFSSTYRSGVEIFIKFAETNSMGSDGKIFCPCRICRNTKRKTVLQVELDLSVKGFCKYYKNCVFHGKTFSAQSYVSSANDNNSADFTSNQESDDFVIK
ncbi:hypothetical protein ACH5RR_001768 [Cinchona calisaya]|uniref:Transposase-associated domain-containing protein n=1 Tax=Cinchona calisaya TaxID=153742 RepID=A0ABD3B4C2_9GENT